MVHSILSGDQMDTGAIEKFAVTARNKLRSSVDMKMTRLGVNPSHPMKVDVVGSYLLITDPNSGIEKRLSSDEDKWRNQLLSVIAQSGYDNVVESIAYTWFNRLIAIRYMEVNNYLPSHVRVLSSIIPGKKEPDLVSQCLSVNFSYTSNEREQIEIMKNEDSSDDLFRLLFLIQCRELNKILPELFTITKLYENMLFDVSYTDPNGVVRDLVDGIPEDDFKDTVQIIGWMYQYYNTELKDDTFSKLKNNIKITKDRIPSATQLFTPDWIVRYMVENSIGKTWLDGHPDSGLKTKWTYYVDSGSQPLEINSQLSSICKEKECLIPENITVIDPCMGSGHILAYAFDVLVQIYESYGYSKEDAAIKIVENNLYGLDIDNRAYQLAYFAVMMKARQYNSRLFNTPVSNHIFPIEESNIITDETFIGFGNSLSLKDKTVALAELDYLIRTFKNAKTIGSLLTIKDLNWPILDSFLNDHGPSLSYTREISECLGTIINVAKCLSSKYVCVITNPPYMGSSGMDQILQQFVKDHFPTTKSDLFSCFIERCFQLSMKNHYVAMITQHSFMFLTSFEKYRESLVKTACFVNMIHLGPHAFDQIGGEVVQTTTFVAMNSSLAKYEGTYYRVIEENSESAKEQAFLAKSNVYHNSMSNYSKMPGKIMAYWVGSNLFKLFSEKTISDYADARSGMSTTDNERFLRFWHEVPYNQIYFNCKTLDEAKKSGKRWFPYNKGGNYRKWYGNNDLLVNWYDDGAEVKYWVTHNPKDPKTTSWSRRIFATDRFFQPGITWSSVCTTNFSCRCYEDGFIFDSGANGLFSNNKEDRLYLAGYLNSVISKTILDIINPTINTGPGTVGKVPIIIDENQKENVIALVKECITLCKEDWDSFERSWDFKSNPLVLLSEQYEDSLISELVQQYTVKSQAAYNKLKTNEETLNEVFLTITGLQNEYSSEVKDEWISVKTVNPKKEIQLLINYFVGCLFGRYSLDVPGLCFAGGIWDASKYKTFVPDDDNIVPINDEEYFGDDIVTYFEKFIRIVFGNKFLEDNLKYVANALEVKGSGTAREKIRKYFLNDYYKDHVQLYQKCPIYWLLDSGKNNGFKALIYIHRYTPDLIGRVRQKYLLKMQRIYDEQFQKEQDQVRRTTIRKKLDELERYDLAVDLYASKNVVIDLNDGVKRNYALFQDIENSKSSKDRIDLLYRI